MSGLLLRLAGPLQSWGERSAFTDERETASFPTRSALIGMFAAAEGITRSNAQALQHYAALEFTVRIDRPGKRLVDYHTVGGGQLKEKTAATSGGDHKNAAVITKRHYLADAVFTVAVTGPAQDTARIAAALEQPHWAPYLGRRSCPPDEPFVLRRAAADPIGELQHHVPLPADPERPAAQNGTVSVTFLWETPPDPPPRESKVLTIYDVPVSFDNQGRSHGKRSLYRTVEKLPTELADGDSPLYERLIDYAMKEASA